MHVCSITTNTKLARYDVVLTTFKLCSQSPNRAGASNATENQTSNANFDNNASESASNNTSKAEKWTGLLHQCHWWRIVIDEGHTLKTVTTKQSQSLMHLKGEHKWVLTATPFQDSIRDISNLMNWIGVKMPPLWWTFLDPNVGGTFKEFLILFCST
ncbi:hypothetical protein RFI_11534 [Reticulomyxa filosa]|uniref:SNF2 N-terminal domain-containing protein n=1 Tax=Reticulomyxa filosa TaxID=46433 RepID=X6NH10_RETFI|nr:hypothetical protein RFI_11534 [Reticulomyxa filosa]|eukprot:ETO25605.1 hypothetical protein RFI_11534 [Reticulomyxa filosa]